MSDPPDEVPASTTYDAALAEGDHDSATNVPLVAAATDEGASTPHALAELPTATTTSLDGGPAPARLRARMRTKYVPAAPSVTVSVVALVPVSKPARLAKPDADPASTMYDSVAGSAASHCSVTR